MRSVLLFQLLCGLVIVPTAQPAALLAEPLRAQACGERKDADLVAAWQAAAGRCPGEDVQGPGVSVVAPPQEEFAAPSFTFEAWIRWPEESQGKLRAETLAEADGGSRSWCFTLDELGSPTLTWREGAAQRQVRGEVSYDVIRPGTWYHIAVAVAGGTGGGGKTLIRFYLTRAGQGGAFCVGEHELARTPGADPSPAAALAVGRTLRQAPPGLLRIGSAAFHRCARDAEDFPAVRSLPPLPCEVPQGMAIDADFEDGSLGTLTTSSGSVMFSPAIPQYGRNYWYAFRVRGAKGHRVRFQCPQVDPMMVAPYLSEDGGKTWGRPSDGTQRRVFSGRDPHLSFIHTFQSDEALVAGSPIVTTTMASEWLDSAAQRFRGRIHDVGRSPGGRPLRVLEIGNPEAPLVYLQAGQHSMMERIGFHLVTSAFETAAGDADLLKRTRWTVMPVVNVDSYSVSSRPGEPNLNRVWRSTDTHPTTSSLRRFLEKEAARTGALAAFDVHSGTVWRGHTLLGRPSARLDRFEAVLATEGLTFEIRRRYGSGSPAAEAGPAGTFSGFAATLPGMQAAYTLELALLAERTPQGAGPTSPETLRRDGVQLCRAIKRLATADTK